MKTSFILQIVIFIFFGSLLRLDGLQAQAPQDTTRFIDKLEIGTGFGVDHLAGGVKIQYLLSDNLTVYSGLGPFLLLGNLPVLGLQYNFKNNKRYKNLNPYILAQVGRDYNISLSHLLRSSSPSQASLGVSDRKVLNSANLGIGIRFITSRLVSINIGVTKRFLNRKKAQDFVDEFNVKNGSNYGEIKHRFLPLLGISVPFQNFLKFVKEGKENLLSIF